MPLMPINPYNGYQKPINRRPFQGERVLKIILKIPEKLLENSQRNLCAKKLGYSKEILLQILQGD